MTNEAKRDEDTAEPLVRLRNSIIVLGITGDSLFARIREDLERGLVGEARMHLNFVDAMDTSNAVGQGPARNEVTNG